MSRWGRTPITRYIRMFTQRKKKSHFTRCRISHLSYTSFPGRRQDGHGRGVAHGGHGALLGGASGGDAAAVGGRRSAGVLLEVQRVPAQRLGEIVSIFAVYSQKVYSRKKGSFSHFHSTTISVRFGSDFGSVSIESRLSSHFWVI